MASLKEQREIVRAVYERPFGRKATEDALIVYFLKRPVFSSDRNKDLTNLSEGEMRKREHEITTLIRACASKKDHFIEPVTKEEVDLQGSTWENIKTYTVSDGYYATSRGTDLLNIIGFISIALEKYSPITLFFSGTGVATLILGGLYWLIINFPTFLCKILPLLNWC